MNRARLFLSAVIMIAWINLPPSLNAQQVSATASAEPNPVGVTQPLQLTITISGSDSGEALAPRLPRFKNFRVVGGPSVSTQFQWINGRSSSTKSFTYTLLAEQEGEYTLDPIEMTVGGKTFRTDPLAVRVTAEPQGGAQPRRGAFDPFSMDDLRPTRSAPVGDEVLVTAELDRNTAYVGQQVTLTYHLSTQVSVTGLQLEENPPLTGFWVEDLQVSRNPTGIRKVINGREYLDYVVKKQALFPNNPGELKIPAATFAVSVRTTGNDFFGILGRSETIYRKTKEVALNVRPLPAAGQGPGFVNAVGSFNLTSNVDRTEAATGDAVTLKVKITGRGNLKMISDLSLPPLADFSTYSPKHSENIRVLEGDLVGGDKTWEFVIVPKAPGNQTIPPVTFTYFDPDRGSYQTLRTEAHPLAVTRSAVTGAAMTGLSGIDKQTLTRQGTDINFIKLAPGDLTAGENAPYRTWWFYVLAAVPLLANAGAYLYQKERFRETQDAVLARSRRARRKALARLRGAERSGRNQARIFYDEAAAALSGYVADKFNLPEIALTGDSLDRHLTEQAVAAETVGEITKTLQECDFARFVTAAGSAENMNNIAERIRRIILTLERT